MHKPLIANILLLLISLSINLNTLFSQNINHWEMLVAADDTWHYFPGISEPPVNWPNIDFEVSSWELGRGGFGYGDGDDGTTINPVASVYIRLNFNIIDLENISRAILHVDYDDAFVAYLNGHEIARANIGTIGVKPKYSDLADTYREAQMYSGGSPELFFIHNDTLFKYLNEGENVLALQVHNQSVNSSDLSILAFLTVGISNDTYDYRQIPDWLDFTPIIDSNIPLLVIETLGATILDDPKITARLKVIDNGPGKLNSYFDEATDYEGYIGIELRGQSSQMFPKKSFSIETRDELGVGIDVSLLGMPEEEDWVLYAPYSDKTMLRNAITFQLGSQMGAWQPRFEFCEVFLNGDYQGVYLLIEKIKRDADRVDIAKLNPDEISGDDLTGGYIVKVDKIWDLAWNEYFYTYPTNRYYDARNYAFTYVYPDFDEIVTSQQSYIKTYLTNFQNTLNGSSFKDPENGYSKYIDVNSFVDFQIMNELSNNVDGYRYSTYFYKKKDSDGGKLFAGPLWDFNLGYGNVDYSPLNLATDRWLYPNYGPNEGYPMHWWARLMEDPIYKEALYKRWTELRAGPFNKDTILNNLEDMVEHLGSSIDRNFEKWPIIGEYVWPNFDYKNATYEEEFDYLTSWLINRINWMDNNITSTTGLSEAVKFESSLVIYPNPASEFIYVSNIPDLKYIDIYNIIGQKVKTLKSIGDKIQISELPNGVYMLSAENYSGEVFSAKFIKN